MTRLVYSLAEAAAQVSHNEATLRRAIRSTDPNTFPPPLRAKRNGRRFLILHDDLVAWAASLPDA